MTVRCQSLSSLMIFSFDSSKMPPFFVCATLQNCFSRPEVVAPELEVVVSKAHRFPGNDSAKLKKKMKKKLRKTKEEFVASALMSRLIPRSLVRMMEG
ncbi:hypothetical protein RUM43_003604 [Polyplax serrata]|uniref:Uncharacterized protein n=1 Tax=Polyplax serrata TaxID=468196 RepID=A0AAN8PHJ1_POLSC